MRSLRFNSFSFFRLAALGLLPLCGCSPPPETAAPGAAPRVVSLAPSLTEIICAVGAATQLVGRTSACDYPAEIVRSVPVVGGFGAPSLDLLVHLRPTLVLEVALEDAAIGAAIDQAGLARRRVACATVDDIPRAILQVGRLAGRDANARALAESILAGLAGLRAKAAERKAAGRPEPLVFVEIWDDPLTTVGKRSFLSDLVGLAGGRNLGDEAADKDYFAVSAEWVITRNPDVIVCLYMSRTKKTEGQRSGVKSQRSEVRGQRSEVSLPCDLSTIAPWATVEALAKKGDQQSATSNQQPSTPRNAGQAINFIPLRAGHQPSSPILSRIAARTGWADIAAVRHRRVYDELDNSLILRPGPRVLEGIESLRQCIENCPRQGDMEADQ